jgi:hypothetical protein
LGNWSQIHKCGASRWDEGNKFPHFPNATIDCPSQEGLSFDTNKCNLTGRSKRLLD